MGTIERHGGAPALRSSDGAMSLTYAELGARAGARRGRAARARRAPRRRGRPDARQPPRVPPAGRRGDAARRHAVQRLRDLAARAGRLRGRRRGRPRAADRAALPRRRPCGGRPRRARRAARPRRRRRTSPARWAWRRSRRPATTASTSTPHWRAVEPEDVLTLIYTSGTTGPPKGVELTHANVLAELRGVHAAAPLPEGGRVVSFLPAAHIADRWSSHYSALMAYGREVTCVADAAQLMAVVAELRPDALLRRGAAGVGEAQGGARGRAGGADLRRWRAPTPRSAQRSASASGSTGRSGSSRAPRRRPVGRPGVLRGPGHRHLRGLGDVGAVLRRDDDAAGRPRYGSVGRPLEGVELRLARRRRGPRARRDRDGRLPRPRPTSPPRRSTATAGCTPATSGASTRTASCGSSTARRSSSSTRRARTCRRRTSRRSSRPRAR